MDRLEEQIAICRSAWAAVRELRLSRSSPSQELVRSARQIENRRTELLREVRQLRSGDPSADSRLDSLDIRLAFAMVTAPRDFSLILGDQD